MNESNRQSYNESNVALEAINLCKTFDEVCGAIDVLRHVDLQVKCGDFICVLGSSGSGKSTLLHLLAGLEAPTLGVVKLNNQDYATLNPDQRARWRGQQLGFVYQLHHLLPEFTALENVAMPLRLQGVAKSDTHQRAAHWLEQVGLKARLSHRPAELSGGERQRVAIARAMVSEPAVILADEPTGNLDEETAHIVQNLMFDLNQKQKMSFVVVTHDKSFAQRAHHTYHMHLGQLNLA